MSNGFVLHIHYNNAPPMTSNSNFNVCVLVGNVNSILPCIIRIELEYFGSFVTSYIRNVRFRSKTFASNYGYQEKLHEDYEKRLLCDEAILMYVAITSKPRTYTFMCHVPNSS